jgi:hypothetical protein
MPANKYPSLGFFFSSVYPRNIKRLGCREKGVQEAAAKKKLQQKNQHGQRSKYERGKGIPQPVKGDCGNEQHADDRHKTHKSPGVYRKLLAFYFISVAGHLLGHVLLGQFFSLTARIPGPKVFDNVTNPLYGISCVAA